MKNYIQSFQEGNSDALNHLLQFREINGVTRLQFADKQLNDLLSELSNSYLSCSASDIEQFFVDSLYRLDKKGNPTGVFIKCKLIDDNGVERTHQAIWKWCQKTIRGFVNEQAELATTYGEKSNGTANKTQVVSDAFTDAHGGESLNSDQYSYNEWSTSADISSGVYDGFIQAYGGLENILLETQYKYFSLVMQGYTQDEVAEKYGVKQQTISQSIQESETRIKSGYLAYRAMLLLTKQDDGNAYQIATEFIQQYNSIRDVDDEGTFDYYSYTQNWMLKHISQRDMEDNFEQLALNKPVVAQNFYDLLMENGKKGSSNLLQSGLGGTLTVTRDKDRWVMSIMFSLNRIIKNHEAEIKKSSKGIVG